MLKIPSYPNPNPNDTNLNRLVSLTVPFLLGGIKPCRGMLAAARLKHHPRRLSQRNTNRPEGLYPYTTVRICVAKPFFCTDTTLFQTYANWSQQQVSLAYQKYLEQGKSDSQALSIRTTTKSTYKHL